MALPQGNLCMFLLCILFQTVVLIALFRPSARSDNAPTSPPIHNDIAQLMQTVKELTQIISSSQKENNNFQQMTGERIDNFVASLTAAQEGNVKEIQEIQKILRVSFPNSNTEVIPSDRTGESTNDTLNIRLTHPGLMKYRYTLADAESNPGEIFKAFLQPDLMLLNENGTKFWGANVPFMAHWVFDTSGETGELIVRDAFRTILGSKASPNLVLDVGSNTGFFSLIAAVYNTKRIYAFDPQPLCTRYVSESAKVNGFDKRIAAINAFVARDEQHVAQIPVDTCNGVFKVGSNAGTHQTAEIHSVNLDSYFLNDPDQVDLMKVDVEGAELIVLEGAQELFKQHRVRNLVVEITAGWWQNSFDISYDVGSKLIKDVLVDSGYKVWLLPFGTNPPVRIVGWEELDKSMRPPPGQHNQKNFLFSLDDVYN